VDASFSGLDKVKKINLFGKKKDKDKDKHKWSQLTTSDSYWLLFLSRENILWGSLSRFHFHNTIFINSLAVCYFTSRRKKSFREVESLEEGFVNGFRFLIRLEFECFPNPVIILLSFF
jgi:hypothetical protein